MDLPENYIVILVHEGIVTFRVKHAYIKNTENHIQIVCNEENDVYLYAEIPKTSIKSIEIGEESFYDMEKGVNQLLSRLNKKTIIEVTH